MTQTLEASERQKALGFDGNLTIAVSVSDLDKAIEWYGRVLGLSLLYKLDDMGWAEMASPVASVNVGLGVTKDLHVKGNTPVWGCRDIEHTRSQLEKEGVVFDGETMVIPGMVKLADFKDPDGNPWKLFESLSEAGEG